ncbi:lyase family protein, partial [Actinomadura viridis]|uniref:lyase family protein n=1 Tax=Actinomadura viridis TaxID=58110 RepID=UPI0031E5DE1F
SSLGLDGIAELTHFACTSEDINSTAYALTVKRAVHDVWLPKLRQVIAALRKMAEQHKDAAMLARTHGQPATPTTMGKELAVFAWRLERVAAQVAASEFLAKFSGATGTWSAHVAADPQVDWPLEDRFQLEAWVEQSLNGRPGASLEELGRLKVEALASMAEYAEARIDE